MEATFTKWAAYEMLLYYFYFTNAEFPINVKMKTSNCLITIHNISSFPGSHKFNRLAWLVMLTVPVYFNIIRGAFIPSGSAIYCKSEYTLRGTPASI